MKVSSVANSSFAKNIAVNNKPVKSFGHDLKAQNFFDNGLSEAIGRSLVSFKSKIESSFEDNDSGYKYSSATKDKNKASYSFDYKKNGQLCFKVSKQQEQTMITYDPKTQTETKITVSITPDNQVQIRESRINPESETLLIARNANVVYASSINKLTGDKQTYSYDIEQNRKIYTNTVNGKEEVKVVDMDLNAGKGEEVTKGPKTWISEQSKDGKKLITKNIVQDIVVKEESLNPKDPFIYEYYEDETNYIKSERYYDRRIRMHVTNRFYNLPGEKISSQILSNKKGDYLEITTFNKEGKETGFSIIDNRRRKEALTTVYIPGTNTIDYKIINSKNGKTYTKIKYKEVPNRPESKEIRVEGTNELFEKIILFRDGETPKIKTEYYDDNSKIETLYFYDGQIQQEIKYNSNNQVVEITNYQKDSSDIYAESTKYQTIVTNPETGYKTTYSYNSSEAYPSSHTIEDEQGNLIESAKYYAYSNNIHIRRIPLGYGLFEEIEYSEKTDKYGRPKIIRHEKPSAQEIEEAKKWRFVQLNKLKNHRHLTDTPNDILKEVHERLIQEGEGHILSLTDEEGDAIIEMVGLKGLDTPGKLNSVFDNERLYKKIFNALNEPGRDKDETKMLIEIINNLYK